MKQKPHDPVQSPAYYTDGRYETVEAIEAWGLDHHAGDALAYISRAGKKSPDTYRLDLQKALWYIDRILAEPRLRDIDPQDVTLMAFACVERSHKNICVLLKLPGCRANFGSLGNIRTIKKDLPRQVFLCV